MTNLIRKIRDHYRHYSLEDMLSELLFSCLISIGILFFICLAIVLIFMTIAAVNGLIGLL